MDGFFKLAERRISEAMERGEFDDLDGRGQRLDLEEYFRTPAELRMAYKILKNADCVPPELDTKKEITRLEELLDKMPDEKERLKAMRRLNYMVTKLNVMRRTRVEFEESQRYYGSLVEKLAREEDEGAGSQGGGPGGRSNQ